ncbi:MAG TPA: hypothetical protein VI934_05050 [Candidatus Nanoarchaeia archaeon]|nr:hypothetical protein [Candidatus Nanoarchaeia archaeon]
MTNYDVYATESFKKLYSTLDRSEQIWIEKMKKQLEDYPTGKPLHYDWFREKKYLNKRLYFLIDETTKKILFTAFASKKEQQKTINFVIANKEELLNHLRNL